MIRHILTIFSGFFSAFLLFAPGDWTRGVFTEFEIFRVVVFAIFIVLVLSYLGKKHTKNIFASIDEMPEFAKICAIVLPLVVLAVAAIEIFLPEFAVILIRDENPGWNFRRGIFIKAAFQLISAVIFVILAVKCFRKKQISAGIISFFLVLVLVVMAGEELSWGQRIFRWETPENYAAINEQGETNLHNLATVEFQTVLYSGCWILLVGLPFFAEQLRKISQKIKLFRPLDFFIPPQYFLLIFAPAFALGDPITSDIGVSLGPIMFYTLVTLVILLYLVIFARDKIAEKISLNLGIFLIALFCNLFISKITTFNFGVATEYLELFINFGILLWAIQVKNNVSKKYRKSKKLSQKNG